MNLSPKCLRCNSEMEQGFVPHYLNYFTAFIFRWHKGHPPKKRGGVGRTKAFFEGGVPIGAFRCNKCGQLEFFAWNELEPK